MANFLLENYPVIDCDDYYLIYTYFHKNIVKVPKKDFNEKTVLSELKNHGLTVTPKSCPGDYSDCVELVISLTNACNLRCKYCFIGEEGCTIKNISTDNIEKSLKLLGELAEQKNKKTVYIQFFGGEPTLRPDLIEYTISKANEILSEYNIEFGITTNGVFDDEIVDLIVNNNFVTTISMDGLPEFQNSQRVRANGSGTSEDVEHTLNTLTSKGIKVIVRITVTKMMINHFREIIDYLNDNGVKFIHFEPVTKGGRANDDASNITRPDPYEYSDKLIDAIEYAKEKNVNILTSAIMNAMSPSYSFCDAVGKNKLAVTYEGLLTSCLGVQSQEHPLAPQFVMKNNKLNDWINAKFPSYVSNTSCVPKCEKCFARFVCAGGCPSRNFYANNTIDAVDEMQCVTSQKIFEYYITSLYNKNNN